MKRKILLSLCTIFLSALAFAQGSDEYTGGLKVKLNDDGSKYFRLITWHQVWARYNDNNTGSLRSGVPEEQTFDYGLRRSRFLMYAQINKRFLILTHFGINNQNAVSGGVLGTDGKKPQLYMHDAWVDFTVFEKYLNVGLGLHYWNGISRLTNASTLNLMTMDAPIFNWATIEATDQFARNIGVFAKGKIGKLDYRLALNDAFATNSAQTISLNQAQYNPRNNKKIFAGYASWQFWESESNLLPYAVGSYLGTKKVFNIGAGFYNNPSGMWYQNDVGDTLNSDIMLWAVDAFLDLPLNEERGDALTAYAVYYNYDFGPNNVRNIGIMNPANGGGALRGNALPVLGTGTILYTQVGYLVPHFSDKVKLQPYVAYSNAQFEGLTNAGGDVVPVSVLDLGANFYLDGHHAKFTLNYRNRPDFTDIDAVVNRPEITLQAMIYL